MIIYWKPPSAVFDISDIPLRMLLIHVFKLYQPFFPNALSSYQHINISTYHHHNHHHNHHNVTDCQNHQNHDNPPPFRGDLPTSDPPAPGLYWKWGRTFSNLKHFNCWVWSYRIILSTPRIRLDYEQKSSITPIIFMRISRMSIIVSCSIIISGWHESNSELQERVQWWAFSFQL